MVLGVFVFNLPKEQKGCEVLCLIDYVIYHFIKNLHSYIFDE